MYNEHGYQQCRHWEPHTTKFEEWERERFEHLEATIDVPLSSLPAWNDVAVLREECRLRCKPCDETKLKKATTAEKLERFLLARCRKGSELSANKLMGVRHCKIDVVTEDLRERKMLTRDMGEAEQREAMEARLRLECEYKRMKVLRQDQRFLNGSGNLSDDLGRVIIDTLHAPMRMNEKVLYLLYSKAYDNKTKKKAAGVFDVMSKKLRAMGKLGQGWGPGWDDKHSDKLGSFALPYDQSKRIFNKTQLPQLEEVIDLACGTRSDDAAQLKQFMNE